MTVNRIPFFIGVFACLTTAAHEPLRAGGWSVRDVGEYAGMPWPKTGTPIEPGSSNDRTRRLNLAVRSINLKDDLTDVHYRMWSNEARYGAEQGKNRVINPYYTGGQEFRHFLQRYLITGKPVVLMPWVSGQGATEWSPRLRSILEDQLQAALD